MSFLPQKSHTKTFSLTLHIPVRKVKQNLKKVANIEKYAKNLHKFHTNINKQALVPVTYTYASSDEDYNSEVYEIEEEEIDDDLV